MTERIVNVEAYNRDVLKSIDEHNTRVAEKHQSDAVKDIPYQANSIAKLILSGRRSFIVNGLGDKVQPGKWRVVNGEVVPITGGAHE
jgi:hypothetical protein